MLDRAIAAFDEGEYDVAYSCFLPLAQDGNAAAQLYLGCMYNFGLGVEIDGEKAVHWYLGAAGQNEMEKKISAVAYHNLSTLYAVGLPGFAPNHKLAFFYHGKARSLGFDM